MTLRNLNLDLGQQVCIGGRAYAFSGEAVHEGAAIDASRDLTFKDIRTGAPITLRPAEFEALYTEAEVRIVRGPLAERDRTAAPGSNGEDEVARWRKRWCEAYDAHPCSRSDEALRAFIHQTAPTLEDTGRAPPSGQALRVWLRERGAPGARQARYMGDRRGTTAPLRLEPITQRVLGEKAETFFDGVRANPQAVYFATRSAIAELNTARQDEGMPPLRPPSESTVRRYLRRHTDYGRATRRYGWRGGGRRFEPILGSMEAKHVLETAIIDQTLIDCAVIDDEHMINVGRPWLAVMIDVRSRYPLGFCLSFEPPSVETALACVRHAVRPKREYAELYPNLNGEWPAFGVPETIVVDNAWENTGSSFRDACADANISIVFAPVATPEYKGVCERFFGTLNTMLFHRLPGGLPLTPQQRSKLGLDNEREAALLLSDVKRAIVQCIVEVYGRAFHKTLQAAPEQVWRKDAALHGRPYVDDLAGLDLALARLVPSERTLSRAGLVHQDLTYRTPDALAGLLADLLPRQAPRSARPGTARVKVKYHPEDLGQVYVWNPVRRRYAVLECTQPDYARGLSEHHHRLIRDFAQAKHLEFQSEDERCSARARLQDLVLPMIPLSKVRDRQRAQRLIPRDHTALPSPKNAAPADAILLAPLRLREDGEQPHRAPAPKRRHRKHAVRVGAAAPVLAPTAADGAVFNLFAEFFPVEESL